MENRSSIGYVRQVPALTLEAAKAMAKAGEAYAIRQDWTVAIAVVDASGGLLLFHCLDDTQSGSQEIAVQKARTAARLKRPTKALEDAIDGGRIAILSLEGMVAMEGGVPIEVAGRVVGGIGVSGMASPQDAEVAKAGLDVLVSA